MGTMTKRFEAAVAQVRELPEAEQDEIAEVLSIDEADYALTPEQVAEVKRRQVDLQSGNSRLRPKRKWRHSGRSVACEGPLPARGQSRYQKHSRPAARYRLRLRVP